MGWKSLRTAGVALVISLVLAACGTHGQDPTRGGATTAPATGAGSPMPKAPMPTAPIMLPPPATP